MEIDQPLVNRPNETIGIVPSGKQRITHLVRRLYSVLLLFSQQQGEKEEYSAVLGELLAAANSEGSNRTQVKAILREIRAIGVDWNVRDGDREIWKNVGLIEEPGLIDGKGTPTIVTWKLPAVIRARLLDPRGFFTKISLQMMTRLRSGASIALYEICCQYASNDHGKGEGGLTGRAAIAHWMPRLTGSREAHYEYKFFKRDVLSTAVREINEITDLDVELVEHKNGRKVVELQFRVFRKPKAGDVGHDLRTSVMVAQPAQDLPPELTPTSATSAPPSRPSPPTAPTQALPGSAAVRPTPDAKQLARVVALGIAAPVAERICRKYADRQAYLLRHVGYVEARIRSAASAPLQNKAAFLQNALEHGYADEAPAVAKVPSRLPAPTSTVEDVEAQQLELLRRASIWARFQGMQNDAAKTALIDAFLAQTGRTLKTFYRKNGVNNMIVKASLTDWLIREQGF